MKSKQAGGIVSFIIVAVALAGLLAGGLYLSKQQGRTARDNDTTTPQVTTTEGSEQSNEEKGTENTEEGAAEQPAQTNTGTAQNQPQATPNTSAGRGSATPSNGSARTDRVATTGPSESIPSTGPTETVAVTLGLAALVFTGYRFAQSRRALRASALRQ